MSHQLINTSIIIDAIKVITTIMMLTSWLHLVICIYVLYIYIYTYILFIVQRNNHISYTVNKINRHFDHHQAFDVFSITLLPAATSLLLYLYLLLLLLLLLLLSSSSSSSSSSSLSSRPEIKVATYNIVRLKRMPQ